MSDWVIMNNLIYHYTGAEALRNIVLNQNFWITKSDYLNDTSEQEVIKDLILSFFKENGHKMGKKIQAYILQNMDNYFNDYNHYILSFSKTDDSLPLWNYYADVEGYNIGFDKSEFIDTFNSYFQRIDSEVKVVFIPVMYKEEKGRPDKAAIEKILLPLTLFTDEDLEPKIDTIEEVIVKLTNISFTIKHKAYKMEEEERLVVICKKTSDITKREKFRVLKGSFIPYIIYNEESEVTFKIPIKEIKIGPYHTLDVTEKSVIYLMNRKYEWFTDEHVSRSEIPSRY